MATNFLFSQNLLKFEDVRQQIIEFLKSNSEYSATFDWSASNISYIIDTMSYVSMLMSYQVANVANNNFLDTINYRKNAVSRAKEIGYRPKRKTSAKAIGTLTYIDTEVVFSVNDTITVQTNSKFVSNKGNVYLNKKPIILTYQDDNTLSAEYELFEGEIKTFTYIGAAGNTPFQSFTIPSISVEENSLKMSVIRNVSGALAEDWIEAKSIFNLPSSNIFFVEEDSENEYFPKIIFGDNIIGKILESDQTATVEYVETKGSLANNEYMTSIPIDTNSYVSSFALDLSKFNSLDPLSFTFGGSENETLEEIKLKAPKYFSTSGRAVTKQDFKNILNAYPYIMAANVIGGEELYPSSEDQKLGNIYLSGVPNTLNKINFLTDNNSIYLTSIEENTLLRELETYNVVSTKLNFFKPSYIYVEVTPFIELPENITTSKKEDLKIKAKADLISYSLDNFFDYAKYFRNSKLASITDYYPEIISSTINASYYFVINKDSFYNSAESKENSISLPVKKLPNSNMYTNFVKSNYELGNDLGVSASDIPYNLRTIQGKITNSNTNRLIYNEDIAPVVEGDKILFSDIMMNGTTNFFEFHRYDVNTTAPLVRNIKVINDIELSIVSFVADLLDQFVISYEGEELGTMYRTNNEFFEGFVANENDFPIFNTISEGHSKFVEAIYNFSVSGDDKNFTEVNAGDYLIFNGDTSGVWEKTNFKGSVSAVTNEELYTANNANDMYSISVSGDGGGLLTTPAASGDYIIFNLLSESNPNNKWEIANYRNIYQDYAFPIVKEAIDYDIKLVITENELGTTFFNRSSEIFYDHDLIFFNPNGISDNVMWTKLINVSSSGELQNLAVSGGINANSLILETYDYDPITGVQLGELRIVTEYGNFFLYDKIIWPSSITNTANVNDILVYVGDGYWRIFQSILSYVFEIDGDTMSALPLKLNYGDYFDVLGTEGLNSNFDNTLDEEFFDGDQIIYLGNNEWQKVVLKNNISAEDASEFPVIAQLGDILKINEDGYFGNTGSVDDNPYIAYTLNKPYIDGDYIIFTESSSGSMWKQLREYSMIFNPANGKDRLNSLGFNTIFNYTYNYSTKYYEMYFNDIFNNIKIGQFVYDTLSNDTNGDVGKLTFENFVIGNYNSLNQTKSIEVKSLFADSDVLDIIQFIPKNKTDLNNNIIFESEEDFDTRFNQYLIVNIKNVDTL